MTTEDIPSWRSVFTRSRLAPCAFNVRAEHRGVARQLAENAGLPTVRTAAMYSSTTWSTPLLDGFVIGLSTYGWAPPLPSGERIIGYRTFRLLCHLIGLEAPRRLKGEPPVPATETLLRELAEQAARPAAELTARAEVAAGIQDRTRLLQVIRDCFGDDYLPSTEDSVVLDLRAAGRWAEPDFTERQRREFVSAGITVEEAERWLELGFGPRSLVRLHEAGLDEVTRFIDVGFEKWIAVWMTELGISPELMREYQALGCDKTFMLAAFEAPRTGQAAGIAGLREYLHAGWTAGDAATWAQHGLALPQAQMWLSIGIDAYTAGRLVDAGIERDEAAKWISEGASTEDLRSSAFSRKDERTGRG